MKKINKQPRSKYRLRLRQKSPRFFCPSVSNSALALLSMVSSSNHLFTSSAKSDLASLHPRLNRGIGKKYDNKTNIVFTGGHAGITAYCLILEMKKRKLDEKYNFYFIGSKYAMEGSKVKTFEYNILPKVGVKFINIYAGRIQQKFTKWTLFSLFKIPFGFIHAFFLIIKIKPKIVFSLGGFSAYPVVLISKLLGLSIIIHEQTSVIGRSNKYALKFADLILLSRESSKKYINNKKYKIVGNPTLPLSKINNKKNVFNKPVIFVSGGSRGSRFINSTLEQILPAILERYCVIHQTGSMDFDHYKRVKELLAKHSSDYYVYGFIDPIKFRTFIEKCDIFISRAGAGNVSLAILYKKPSIFIPLPFSYLNEQYENAVFVKDYGIAEIILQKDLNPEVLTREINKIYMNKDLIHDRVNNKPSPDSQASEKIVDILENYL